MGFESNGTLKNQRKEFLAALRNGDYAHPGEEGAIDITMSQIPKNSNQLLLDVGCGLGGTANYIEENGWGKVTAIDIEPQMIAHIKQYYPQIQSFLCDANDLDVALHSAKFDVIYMFNSFFSFPDQAKSLSVLSRLAHANTRLLIFDYATPGLNSFDNPFKNSQINAPSNFFPINLNKLPSMLMQSNWRLEQWVDLSYKYKSWYEQLLLRMDQQKEDLIQRFGEKTFTGLYAEYQRLLILIDEGKISGGIVIAVLN